MSHSPIFRRPVHSTSHYETADVESFCEFDRHTGILVNVQGCKYDIFNYEKERTKLKDEQISETLLIDEKAASDSIKRRECLRNGITWLSSIHTYWSKQFIQTVVEVIVFFLFSSGKFVFFFLPVYP